MNHFVVYHNNLTQIVCVSHTLNSYPKHPKRLRRLPNYTNPSPDPTTSPNPKYPRRQSSNEYRPRSFGLTSATSTIILIIFLFLVHIQPAMGHYHGSCIGSTDRTKSVSCSTDDLYVYVNTNHATITEDRCFHAANQARVDVTGSSVTTFSRRPTTNNTLNTSISMASIPNCLGKTVTGSNTNMICKANGMQPHHCSGSQPNWFRYGPINQNGTTTLTVSVYAYGCGSPTALSKQFSFTPQLCQCLIIGQGLSAAGCTYCPIGFAAPNSTSPCSPCTSGKYQNPSAASSWGCVSLELFLSKIKLIFLTF